MNRLYYGDNLNILRRNIADESVDLVYLDPPFNSNRSYNVLFKSHAGTAAQAQIEAFDDTWVWSQQAEELYDELGFSGSTPAKVSDALIAMRKLLGENDVLAYLVMMTARLVELHRVLKPTGSLYLHCDPTASHYLKVMLDTIFGPTNFRNEIVWKRSDAKGDAGQGSKHFGRVNDVILFYSKGPEVKFNPQFGPLDPEYVDRWYRHTDPDGRRYKLDNMLGPGGAAKGNPYYEVMGVSRHWRYSRERMDDLIAQGRVVQTKAGNVPMLKRYLDESKGTPLTSNWADISLLRAHAAEKLGYPTQKPVALLERILAASSDPGDVVLDPFCGCGTTIDAAQKLDRKWIGIDITYLAIDLIQKRLETSYGPEVRETYELAGVPRDVEAAQALFKTNAFDFERWAVTMVNGQPNEKQVGDHGIDGVVRFHLDKTDVGSALVSVKGGKQLNPGMVRDLRGTVERQKSEMGILITLTKPTKGMVEEAQHSGSFTHELSGAKYPLIQIVSVPELLAGKRPNMPTPIMPYKLAKKRSGQLSML